MGSWEKIWPLSGRRIDRVIKISDYQGRANKSTMVSRVIAAASNGCAIP
jgi:hypothetical protein